MGVKIYFEERGFSIFSSVIYGGGRVSPVVPTVFSAKVVGDVLVIAHILEL